MSRLLADPDFVEANARFNTVEVINDFVPSSRTAHADAKAARRELFRDPQVRRVTVEFVGTGYAIVAERYATFTADELAELTASDVDGYAALLALYARFLAKIESNANRYGSTKDVDGPGAVFDHDDAHQEQVVALLEVLAAEADDRPFAARFSSRARTVGYEARKFATPYTVPGKTVLRVQSAIRDAKGDLSAAAAALAESQGDRNGISADRFGAVVDAIQPGRRVDIDDETTRNIDDPNALSALAGVLSGFDDERLDEAWSLLSDREQDVLTAHLGLDGEEPMTHLDVARVLGISRPTVTRAASSGLAILRSAMSR
ncbi:hypothetical protein HUO13_11870 [Saccharopolyspora erythraea]|uniref:sigma factor-like helix-turn-helix DNA-binding protein n=1 Tax=Saccharopolyspora erythraea TaxID=1836 RepID=UPI001BA6D35A|nr:sigma factor-like helix-turn-helix DNA-binding protein [Saccharopolyspora erythraea]QUH01412.1 hypothetical protein HUO13_11870 [Saccharopolyspora erythraea]